MNSAQAKTIPLERVMEALDHSPYQRAHGGRELWYHSPFRKETEPSFKIHVPKNVWSDYGEDVGGNILDFVVYRREGRKCQHSDVSSALQELKSILGKDTHSRRTKRTEQPLQDEESPFYVRNVQSLQNRALIEYLRKRGISQYTAAPHVREIYYDHKGRSYFALAFENESGGHELRNPYFKGTHGQKDISLVRRKITGHNSGHVSMFEGFMDMLSAMTDTETKSSIGTAIVLNSTTMKEKAVIAIRELETSEVHLYLDRDVGGKKLVQYFQDQLESITVLDKSSRYRGFKDFNDYLTNCTTQRTLNP